MKRDIETQDDIRVLIDAFYTKVIADDTIGYIFKETPGFSLEKHTPVMVSFWETLLFGTVSYKGNPMIKHVELHKLLPLKRDHFSRWLYLWKQTLGEHFEGETANDALARAKSIAGIMQVKISVS